MKINSRSDWKLGAAVGTALSLGSGAAVAGPHGFDLHNVFHGASASMAGTSIAHVEDPVSAVFGNPATLTTYYGGTNFMFGPHWRAKLLSANVCSICSIISLFG